MDYLRGDFMANPISKKLKYINKNGEEKEINLYNDFASFSDYDNGNYIAVQADTNTVGYIYCNSKLPKDTTTHFASFIDKNNNLRYAYTEEPTQSQSPSITYTFTTGYDVMPQINDAVYSSKYKDTINGDGTTTRTLLIDKPITQISFYGITNSKYLLSFDDSYGVKLTTCANMFRDCSSLTSVNLSNFDTSNVTDMYFMFRDCSRLTSLDLSNFDTSNVVNMYNMFYSCKGLTSLNLSNFDTSNVVNMNSMFTGCSGLTLLDLSNFDTSNVTSMRYMFSGCSGLTSLNPSSFDTSNVTDMTSMFYSCTGLTSLNLTSFDTSKVTRMSYMFYNVKSTCKVYVNKSKFTKTASQCNFNGSFTYV